MILIRNSQIIDGTGKPPFKADVLVNRDRISAIGEFSKENGDTVIDGSGSYLAPGFIDVNTDSDHYLSIFFNPDQKYFLLQGVTTIIGGQCGSSLSPLIYGSLESIRKWARLGDINVDWHTTKEFLAVLKSRPLGVNFATLTGHSTVRRALVGESQRNLSANEIKILKRIIQESFSQGSFGLSTGLGYAHSKHTPYSELYELGSIIKKAGAVYTTHLRDERAGLADSVRETIKLAKETKAKVIISHLRPLLGFEKEFEKGMELLDHLGENLEIYFDSYPSDTSLVPIYTLLPDWLKNRNLEGMLRELNDPGLRKRILKEMPDLKNKDIVVAKSELDYLIGKGLKEFSENRGLNLKEGLLELMKISQLKTVVFYKNINLDLSIQNLASEKALLASNSPNLNYLASKIYHDRLLNIFPRFLELAQGLKLMTLEKAIYKLTSLPAKIFGFRERGAIKEGHIADLTLFKDGRISHVLVSGQIAVQDGEFTGNLAGKILMSNY